MQLLLKSGCYTLNMNVSKLRICMFSHNSQKYYFFKSQKLITKISELVICLIPNPRLIFHQLSVYRQVLFLLYFNKVNLLH